jgi:beta-lactamase superfamily II metal-dependent hydrolase
VIQRLEQADALILRTDELGTIELSTDGSRMWVETER